MLIAVPSVSIFQSEAASVSITKLKEFVTVGPSEPIADKLKYLNTSETEY